MRRFHQSVAVITTAKANKRVWMPCTLSWALMLLRLLYTHFLRFSFLIPIAKAPYHATGDGAV